MNVHRGDIEASFRAHRERVLGLCVRLLGDRQAAEDVVQDVYLRACSESSAEINLAWLCACARNRCVDLHRRRGVWERVKARLFPVTISAGFEAHFTDRELGWKLLKALPTRMREAMVLRSYVGLNYEQIAEVLEITPESVGVLLSRARKKASELLQKEKQ